MNERTQREAERTTQRCVDCGQTHRRRSNLLRPCSRCGGEVTLEPRRPGPAADPDRVVPDDEARRRMDARAEGRPVRPTQKCTDCGHVHHRVIRVGRPCDVCEGEVEAVYQPRPDPWTPERVSAVLRANREAAICGGSVMR